MYKGEAFSGLCTGPNFITELGICPGTEKTKVNSDSCVGFFWLLFLKCFKIQPYLYSSN